MVEDHIDELKAELRAALLKCDYPERKMYDYGWLVRNLYINNPYQDAYPAVDLAQELLDLEVS